MAKTIGTVSNVGVVSDVAPAEKVTVKDVVGMLTAIGFVEISTGHNAKIYTLGSIAVAVGLGGTARGAHYSEKGTTTVATVGCGFNMWSGHTNIRLNLLRPYNPGLDAGLLMKVKETKAPKFQPVAGMASQQVPEDSF